MQKALLIALLFVLSTAQNSNTFLQLEHNRLLTSTTMNSSAVCYSECLEESKIACVDTVLQSPEGVCCTTDDNSCKTNKFCSD